MPVGNVTAGLFELRGGRTFKHPLAKGSLLQLRIDELMDRVREKGFRVLIIGGGSGKGGIG
jgi:hypothetical protein